MSKRLGEDGDSDDERGDAAVARDDAAGKGATVEDAKMSTAGPPGGSGGAGGGEPGGNALPEGFFDDPKLDAKVKPYAYCTQHPN